MRKQKTNEAKEAGEKGLQKPQPLIRGRGSKRKVTELGDDEYDDQDLDDMTVPASLLKPSKR
ncbi:hypothetical protein VSDG_02943 [Cytospora chrysosperma]|uniref:Uncharacterized protein n=1 Tax=Cytospora chrysosperma TaxID=252740 RepID=A0A423W8N7_CYTCH|nr:hypothetical protein VSDG_02943 [Valsa sordida]